MSIHTVCRICSSPVIAPSETAGGIISCPHCQARIRVPEPAPAREIVREHEAGRARLLPSRRRLIKKPRPKRRGRLPVWVILFGGGALAIGLGVGGYLTVRSLLEAPNTSSTSESSKSQEESEQVARGETAPHKPPESESKDSGGTKYIPRVSEKKLQKFLEGKDAREVSEITDDQVFAIMGEPTRRETPTTVRKNGMIFTIYVAFWDVPGSGIRSQIGFSNGRMAGMILGLETGGDSRKGR